MPLLQSNYTPTFLFKNGHVSTIFPNVFRKIKDVTQKRERIELHDGDFIDIDWSYTIFKNVKKVAIIVHGLEGNAQRQYILGTARHLNHNNWDVIAVNLRNCSGEVNRLYRSYNAGVSEDIDQIINHVISKYSYTNISLCGFSLGGNIILKYLGEDRQLAPQIKAATAISAPCDLHDSLLAINKTKNIIYEKRFIRHLKEKLLERQNVFPDKITVEEITTCKSLMDIDNLYTSKAHGYKDAIDYYTKCSSLQFLKNIKVPTLVLNAKNDSFLGDQCYPIDEAKKNDHLFLEIPDYGGHVGFYLPGKAYYNEQRTLDFFEKQGG
ncbi:alpha/beta fold hydrolase [Aquimarina sp. AD10]|uniref:YheT family hydrolase n=1 Tax=Aquimarina sp. AD10 TaxID=1714849 RepID=UPI000E50CCA6|nr:alpha/beta fold hydrolase [Aquimarina sp. AD10]AXT61608.1 alpha/beta fold hydrolase [Aquimarina sp. AD10]RKN01044.1 alpha/beta fold hydrolase [Aquimarina sp. AD10]